MKKLFDIMKNTEIVTFEIKGLGQECHETLEFKDEIEELERLANIGRQIERMLELPCPQILLTYGKTSENPKEVEFYTIQEILDWGK